MLLEIVMAAVCTYAAYTWIAKIIKRIFKK